MSYVPLWDRVAPGAWEEKEGKALGAKSGGLTL